MSDTASILEVRDLSVEFWVEGTWNTVADSLSYTVQPGEVLAIVGESGSGKSTSSMALLGLLPGNARVTGSAKLDGEELVDAPVERLNRIRGSKIAVIFQEPMTALNPVYTVGYQIVEALQVHDAGLTKAKARTRALELLKMVELPDPQKAFDSYPHQLSGGQRQRAMIAQSISCDPLLLVADEPTTALDVTVQAEILDLLRSLHKRLNSAIVLITHDMGVVADLADHVMVMKNGVAVEMGAVDQVFAAPRHDYTKLLLGSVPSLEVGSTRERVVTDAGEPVLRLAGASIEYPKLGRVPAFRAVDNIDLEIRQGEVVGLVGESGSGKTTVGRAIVGLLPVAEGTATVAGHDLATADPKQWREIRKQIGIVFQDPGSSLNPRWPVGQSIAEPLVLAKTFDKKAIERRVGDLLDQVELSRAFRNRYPHELSGGQRQRVGIARALALAPKLIVADEPTSALDVSVQARVLELLQALQAELQFACLFVSHDLAVVDLLSDRIAVMNRGKIVEQGPADQILRAPKHPYTQRLIAAVPLPDPIAQRERRETRAATR